jgi:hypothetical protein
MQESCPQTPAVVLMQKKIPIIIASVNQTIKLIIDNKALLQGSPLIPA